VSPEEQKIFNLKHTRDEPFKAATPSYNSPEEQKILELAHQHTIVTELK
jgi:hypothetical protein